MTQTDRSGLASNQAHPDSSSSAPRTSWILLGTLLGVVLLLVGLNWSALRRWQRAQADLAVVDARTAKAVADWESLEPREHLLTNLPLALCNPSPYNVFISEVLAVYEKEGRLGRFSSSRCPDEWAPFDARFAAESDPRPLRFRSQNPACDWTGQFLFAAVGWYRYLPDGKYDWHMTFVHPTLLSDEKCLPLAL